MGYMGLDSYTDSDSASDLAYSAIKEMVKTLTYDLENDHGNAYNTCGIINVALFFESFIIPNREFYNIYSPLFSLATKTLDKLKNKIKKDDTNEDWETKSNKNMHLTAYRRMALSLQKYINESK